MGRKMRCRWACCAVHDVNLLSAWPFLACGVLCDVKVLSLIRLMMHPKPMPSSAVRTPSRST